MFTDTKKRSEAGAWVHIKNEGVKMYKDDGTGKPDESKPVRIKVMGPHSPTLQRRHAKRNAVRLKESGMFGGDISKMNVGQIEQMMMDNKGAVAENWADATLAWENMPDEVPECSVEAAEKLYDDFPDLPDQLAVAAAEINDFLALANGN